MHQLKNIPNLITFTRIILIPLVLVLYFLQPSYNSYLGFSWFNFALVITFAIASTTDFIDGYLARKWDASSQLGAFLDPVADKLMVVVALVLLVDFYSLWHVTLCSSIIIMREVLVSALREWMAQSDNRAEIKVSNLGKIKTFMQIFAILFLFYQGSFLGISSLIIGSILLTLATMLTLISGCQYLMITSKFLKDA